MAEQYLPDTFGGMTGAFNAGRLIRAQKQQAQQQQQLSALAPAVLNGDPSATAQAYAIDPATAKQYGEGAERIGLQLHNIANQIKQMHAAGNEQGAAMLYSQAAPMIRQKFPNAPAQWDAAALMPAIDAVVAMTAPGDTQQRNLAVSPGSAIVDPQTGKVIYERPFAPANTPLVDVPDGQGGMIKMAYDPKTQQLSMPQYPGQGSTPQGQSQMAPGEVPFSIDPSLPPEVQAAIRANPQAGSAEGITAPIAGIPQAQAPRLGYAPPKASTDSDTFVPLNSDEVAQLGLPPGTFAQRSMQTGKIDFGPASVQSTAKPMSEYQRNQIKQKLVKAKTSIRGTTNDLDRMAAMAQQVMNAPGLSHITGILGAFPNVPGGPGADAQAKLESLKSQIAFAVLAKMRAMSPTGGALGSVSDAEGKRLEANLASLDKSQSEEQLRQNLQQIIDYTQTSKQNLQGAFQDDFGEIEQGGQPTQAPQQAGWSIQVVP